MFLATLPRLHSRLTFEFIRMISLNINSPEGKIIAFLLELHCISIYAWRGRQKNSYGRIKIVPGLHIKGHQNANAFKPAGQSNHVTWHENIGKWLDFPEVWCLHMYSIEDNDMRV